MTMSAAPVILEGTVGSTAYGLATANSDVDTLGIKLLPVEHFIGLEIALDRSMSEVLTDPADVTYHDLSKYCRLALTCNPTVTELMWLPTHLYTVIDGSGQWLIDNRHEFLSAKRVRDSFMGYATAQFKRLSERGGTFSSDTKNRTQKHARHLARLMFQGYNLWSSGELPIVLEDPEWYHQFGRAVEQDNDVAKDLISWYESAFDKGRTVLPDHPNRKLVEEFVKDTRMGLIDWSTYGTAPVGSSVASSSYSSLSVFDPRNPLGFRVG